MLTFRTLRWEDAAPLYVWRHDPETVKWSINPPPTWDEHLTFMNAVMSKESDVTVMFIGSILGTIPVVCVSRNDDRGVNVMVNPHFRKRGFATEALQFIQKYFPSDQLIALIKNGNEASLKLFVKCGFKYADYRDDYLMMEWTP